MADAPALWDLLYQAADPNVAATLKTEVESAPDRALNRINPLTFAAAHGLAEEPVIAGLVHAVRLGLFDMSWSMVCPGCGGVLDTARRSRRSIGPNITARSARRTTNRRSTGWSRLPSP